MDVERVDESNSDLEEVPLKTTKTKKKTASRSDKRMEDATSDKDSSGDDDDASKEAQNKLSLPTALSKRESKKAREKRKKPGKQPSRKPKVFTSQAATRRTPMPTTKRTSPRILLESTGLYPLKIRLSPRSRS